MSTQTSTLTQDADFRFNARDLVTKIFPEALPRTDGVLALAPCRVWSPIDNFTKTKNTIDLTIKTCAVLAEPSVVVTTHCVDAVSLPDKTKPKKCDNKSCLAGSPTKENCKDKTECPGPPTLCGKCTHGGTECHCSNWDSKCAGGNENSCKDSVPYTITDNNCKDNDVTNGCGCTKSPCSKSCTNAETVHGPWPVSPAKFEVDTRANLLGLLRNELVRRTSGINGPQPLPA